MMMKRLVLYVGIALLGFAFGVVAAVLWRSHSKRSIVSNVQRTTVAPSENTETEWPLTKEIISRSLQSHSFRSDRLTRNSNDEIVWRWLKESIATFPQNWVKLNISDRESYGVVLYPLKALEPSQLDYYNKELEQKGLPPLKKGKAYQPINVYQGNIICPNWSGIIDVEEAKLVYFEGRSA